MTNGDDIHPHTFVRDRKGRLKDIRKKAKRRAGRRATKAVKKKKLRRKSAGRKSRR